MSITHFSGPVDSKNGYRINGTPISSYSYVYEDFKSNGVSSLAAGGAASGTANTLNVIGFERNVFNYVAKGTQTILAPTLTATGLNVAMDQTDNDGMELFGSAIDRSRYAFTIGTSPAFFATLRFKIGDASGTDDCAFGFRKSQAYQANFDDYTDAATLNVISGDINIETILNNAATTTTDTTANWADGETHTLTVLVSGSGVVTYEIDGAAPSTTAAFTFDSGDVVHPFFFFLNATDLVDTLELISFECGSQEFRGKL